ncbi:MAG: hypothetical protein A2538_04670 [Candidatus Magasanikbacteria bacterium RIFOXYD2_FULL_41_14]|uniref:Methyltransferase type 11 domain-containing protein n=1 Tax=Candidatus Magasanikbacteria bacterium RIFOXYD2_FULL_41_14 TaxID=1798709 RepID=A0A1F6PG36_9BACT|nr:MAG: hypothetical protein A2538_04670 [Candidatus Magasanikbacteria bacterium RIFOXYD2_FULL_41_14]
MEYFDKINNRLVFVEKSPTAVFWDDLWTSSGDLKKQIVSVRKDNLVCLISKKYLKTGDKVLDGGCGKGQFVYALQNYFRFDTYGVDFAEKIVAKINQTIPTLKIKLGDVRNLSFEDDFFDGYWSLGVIEHFYDGYDSILLEIRRVLKKGGFLFITFPHLSWLRKLKIKLGKYREFVGSEDNKKDFYQFALDDHKVIEDIEKLGFVLKHSKKIDGVKGLKDEVSVTKPILRVVYNSNFLILKVIKFFLNKLLSFFSSHMILLVFELRNK